MKYNRLMEIIRETINEELAFESQASDDAKKQGLEYLGFGRYGKDGKTTHQAVDGKLTPVDQIQSKSMAAKGPPIKVSTSKPIGHKVADIGPGGKQHNVQMSPQWIKQNLPQDPDPELDPKRKGSPFEKSTKYVLKSVFEKAGFKNNQEVPKAEFLEKTGLTQDQLDAYAKAEEAVIGSGKDPRGKGVPPIFTDTGDTVRVNDPWDEAQQLNMGENTMQKAQLKEIIREIMSEEFAFESQASDDAKKQGLEYMGFGRYGKDGKITHTTQSGKLVSVRDANDRIDQRRAFPVRGRKSPEAQRAANTPTPDMSPSADTHAKIVSKVKDKLSAWYDSADADDMEHVPTAEFSKMTGIPERALRMYGQTNPDPMEDGVYYDAERDTFTIGGYPDGYGDGDTPFDDEL